MQLRVGLNVSADEHGHPRIAMTSCFFEVDALNVTLTGDARYEAKGLLALPPPPPPPPHSTIDRPGIRGSDLGHVQTRK